MSSALIGRPVNLTLLADRLSRAGRERRSVVVLERPGLAAEIRAADEVGRMNETSATQDEIYVVIAGYGYLRSADGEEVELTEGDVLLVPAGSPSRFERVSPNFRTWRIALDRAAA